MKKIIASFLLLAALAGGALADSEIYYKVKIDYQNDNEGFTINLREGDTTTVRAYTYLDGSRFYPTNWVGKLLYGTNEQFSSSLVEIDGSVSAASNNYIYFDCSASDLGTNGDFFAQIQLTNSLTGEIATFDPGRINLSRNPAGGTYTLTVLRGIVNGDLITWTGARPWTNEFGNIEDALLFVSNKVDAMELDVASISNNLDSVVLDVASISNDLDAAELTIINLSASQLSISNVLDSVVLNLDNVSNDVDLLEIDVTNLQNSQLFISNLVDSIVIDLDALEAIVEYNSKTGRLHNMTADLASIESLNANSLTAGVINVFDSIGSPQQEVFQFQNDADVSGSYWASFIVKGTYAYVSTYGSGFDILSLSSLPAISVTASQATANTIRYGINANNYYCGFTPISPFTFQVWDVTSSPLSPSLVGSVALSDIFSDPNNSQIAASGNYVYITTMNGAGTVAKLIIVDISTPASPSVTEQSYGGISQYPSDAALIVSGSSLVSLSDVVGSQTLSFWDISTPSVPVFLGTRSSEGECIGAKDEVLYCAGTEGIEIFTGMTADTMPTYSRTILQDISFVQYSMFCDSANNRLYSGSYVFDITLPSVPILIGNISTTGSQNQRSYVSGSYSVVPVPSPSDIRTYELGVIDATQNLKVHSTLEPTTSSIDLGTAASPFRSIYLQGSTIYMDGEAILSYSNGAASFPVPIDTPNNTTNNFTNSVVYVKDATTDDEAVNKGQMDAAIISGGSGISNRVAALETNLGSVSNDVDQAELDIIALRSGNWTNYGIVGADTGVFDVVTIGGVDIDNVSALDTPGFLKIVVDGAGTNLVSTNIVLIDDATFNASNSALQSDIDQNAADVTTQSNRLTSTENNVSSVSNDLDAAEFNISTISSNLLYETVNREVIIYPTNTTPQIQAQYDAVLPGINSGITVTMKWTNGTFNLTAPITIQNHNRSGVLLTKGTGTGTNTTTIISTFASSVDAFNVVQNQGTVIRFQDIKFVIDNDIAIESWNGFSTEFNRGWIVGDNAGTGVSLGNGDGIVENIYVQNLDLGILAKWGVRARAQNNASLGNVTLGVEADAALILQQGAGIQGTATNSVMINGGLILPDDSSALNIIAVNGDTYVALTNDVALLNTATNSIDSSLITLQSNVLSISNAVDIIETKIDTITEGTTNITWTAESSKDITLPLGTIINGNVDIQFYATGETAFDDTFTFKTYNHSARNGGTNLTARYTDGQITASKVTTGITAGNVVTVTDGTVFSTDGQGGGGNRVLFDDSMVYAEITNIVGNVLYFADDITVTTNDNACRSAEIHNQGFKDKTGASNAYLRAQIDATNSFNMFIKWESVR